MMLLTSMMTKTTTTTITNTTSKTITKSTMKTTTKTTMKTLKTTLKTTTILMLLSAYLERLSCLLNVRFFSSYLARQSVPSLPSVNTWLTFCSFAVHTVAIQWNWICRRGTPYAPIPVLSYKFG